MATKNISEDRVCTVFDCRTIISDPSRSRDFVHLPSGSGGVKKPLPAIDFQKLNAGFSGDTGGQ